MADLAEASPLTRGSGSWKFIETMTNPDGGKSSVDSSLVYVT